MGKCECSAEKEWEFDPATGVLTIYNDSVMKYYEASFICFQGTEHVADSFHHNCYDWLHPEEANILLLGSAPDTPWKDYHDAITCVVLAPSVTKIGENAFVGCLNLERVVVLNPNCQFPNAPFQTLDRAINGASDFTIHGYADSTADAYDDADYYYKSIYYTNSFVSLPCTCSPVAVKIEMVKATCAEAGNIRMHCTTCNSTIFEESIPGGHHYASVVTAPTCLEGGYTTYTCTVCGDSYTGNETAKLSHNYETAVTAPSCIEGGFTTRTCTVCGKSYTGSKTAALGHDYQPTVFVGDDGIGYTQYDCSRCDEYYREDYTNSNLKFKQASVTLSSDFSLNFYIRDTVLAGFSDPYVVFKKAMYDKTGNIVDYETVEVTEYTRGTSADGVACHIFQFTGITSAEMGSNVSATLYASKDGIDYIGKTVDYSVVKYATNMLGKTSDAKLRTLLVDLLNYGAQAQTYFGYNTANPANKSLSDTQKAYATATAPTLTSCRRSVSNTGATVSFKTATLVLENKVAVNYYLNLKNYTGSVDDLYAVVKYKDHLGNEWDCRIDSEDFDYKAYGGSNYYVVNFSQLNAMQMRTPCTLELFSKTTNERVSNTLYYSIESYAYSMKSSSDTALVKLLETMMKYGDATAAYFVR